MAEAGFWIYRLLKEGVKSCWPKKERRLQKILSDGKKEENEEEMKA